MEFEKIIVICLIIITMIMIVEFHMFNKAVKYAEEIYQNWKKDARYIENTYGKDVNKVEKDTEKLFSML